MKKLVLKIENQMYEWDKQYITGVELKQLAGIPNDKELYLSLLDPWDDELITDETSVNLARPGIESFYIKRNLKFFINDEPFKWDKQHITGMQIRQLGRIDREDEIFLRIPSPHEDELIANETVVDLARPGTEHFISKSCPRKITIIVNGRPNDWDKKQISFEEVVRLAFPQICGCNTAYTLTYSKGPKENPSGSMVRGDEVYVKDKMNFNVTATDKS